MIIQKAIEYRVTAHLAFIDFTRAFGLLDHAFMLKALLNHGVGTTLVKLIQEIYTDLQAKIITDIEGESFEIRRGVKQGDPMSPLLFNCALDRIFRNLKWETKGIRINGDLLNNLRFADDVVLVVGCWDNLQAMLEELSCQSRSAGMEINMSKTKILTNTQQHQKIKIKDQETDLVDSIIYLGQTISFQNQDKKEINRR